MKTFEAIVVPENPMMPSAYPPRVLLEGETEESVREWFKEAKEQGGQYVGCRLLSVREVK